MRHGSATVFGGVMKQLIYIAEDEKNIRETLQRFLENDGYEVCAFETGDALLGAFFKRRSDLVILDIMMPGTDGLTCCRLIREKDSVPIILLTAKDTEYDYVNGILQGGDDYLTKPFLMQELLLRVQHLLRRAYRTELRRSRVLTLGDCTVNLQDAAVRRADGTTLALTATERALLQRLADDRGHIVTYDAVCEAVWDADYYGYENSLNVHIRHLREKIEPDPGHPQWLLTVRGIGYRLTGEV